MRLSKSALMLLGVTSIGFAPVAWIVWILTFMTYEDAFASADHSRFGTLSDMGWVWFLRYIPYVFLLAGISALLVAGVRSLRGQP